MDKAEEPKTLLHHAVEIGVKDKKELYVKIQEAPFVVVHLSDLSRFKTLDEAIQACKNTSSEYDGCVVAKVSHVSKIERQVEEV